jgi:thiamine transport system substrate-binding protein
VQNAFKKIAIAAGIASMAVASLTGCAAAEPINHEITVVTHDSAVFDETLLAKFTKETGIKVTQVKAGDAGAMTNKLVLTKDAPIGDLFYGIDNTFASVADENKIVDGQMTAIDFGDVCFNYDKTWFSTHEQTAPTSISDLTKPEFKGLTVVTNPATSSPGMAFLAATVSVFGNSGYQQYWRALAANDVKVAAGWEDAYFTDFSGSSGAGDYPIVLSYSSSPAFEVRDNGESQTESIMDGCFRQTEYAGVLANAKNPSDAAKFIEFLTSTEFQATLPDTMYVYPAVDSVALPEAWSTWAPAASAPVGGELDIAANRKTWLENWSAILGE